jgi:hypothetical protein
LGERGSHPTPIGAAGLTCPDAAGVRGPEGWRLGGAGGLTLISHQPSTGALARGDALFARG